MDSRSGPEVPSKVHGFGEAVKLRYGGPPQSWRTWALGWALSAGFLAGCAPDATQPEGALGALAEGCGRAEARALFPVLDERSRFALDAIAQARRSARQAILASYPAEAQPDALAQLGDAQNASSGAELFALRCGPECVAQLCRGVSAPQSVEHDGGLAKVHTVRGADVLLYRAQKHYGLVYQTEALVRERRRAFAELATIEANAKVYAQQKALR